MKKIIPKLVGTYLNSLSVISPATAGKQGFNIFCTPIAPPVKSHHHQFLETARKFHFHTEGNQLQAYQWGQGKKKILFLHGWQSHSFRWKKYIKAFSPEEYSIYAFDAPAHGLSSGKYINIPIYSDAIKAFLQKIGAMDAVISHSMGSFSALHALHHHQDIEVNKLVLLGSPGEANDFIYFYQNMTGLSDRTLQHILNYFERILNRKPDYFSAPAFASTLKVPGLIIHDKGDDEAPYHHAQRIHEVWTQSKLITTEGFGHNLRNPEVIEMVKDFVMQGELLKRYH